MFRCRLYRGRLLLNLNMQYAAFSFEIYKIIFLDVDVLPTFCKLFSRFFTLAGSKTMRSFFPTRSLDEEEPRPRSDADRFVIASSSTESRSCAPRRRAVN